MKRLVLAATFVPTLALAQPKPATRLRVREVVAAAHACAGRPALELAGIKPASATTWFVDLRNHRKKQRFTIDAVTGACNGKAAASRNVKLKAIKRMPDLDLDAVFAESVRCVAERITTEPGFDGHTPELHVGPALALLIYQTPRDTSLTGPPTLDVSHIGKTCGWVPGE